MIQGSEKGRSGSSLVAVKLSDNTSNMVNYVLCEKQVDEITSNKVIIYQSRFQ